MNPKAVYILCGYFSVAAGIGAILCSYQMMLYALMLSAAGFITATVNIFLNVKNSYDDEKFPKGYLGMFLSSIPILFLFVVKIKFSGR